MRLDYVMIVAYSIGFALMCIWIGQIFSRWVWYASVFFAAAAVIAGVCDWFENGGLMQMVTSGPVEDVVVRTYWLSTIKLALFFGSLTWWLGGFVVKVVTRR